jgi:hypothetical protein
MATITLKYNAKNTKAKKAIEFMLSLGVFTTDENIPALDRSLKEAREGRIYTAKSVKDLMSKI